MFTYHIHITGIVQGVGFRPLVCKAAIHKGLKGWVCNDVDGVHIEFNAEGPAAAEDFYQQIISNPPKNARLQKYSLSPTANKEFTSFEIIPSKKDQPPDLLLTPDIALCRECKAEIEDGGNRRWRYAFTTCLNCGPRYSIIKSLPYDRENTTMAYLAMCRDCAQEYQNVEDRRHYSQTNSCPDCAVAMHLYSNSGQEISSDCKEILHLTETFLNEGKILAVKGIGGYLLMCDATNAPSVNLLRNRKHRPAKPLAVMYNTVEDLAKDVWVVPEEQQALESREAPIVLCKLKSNAASGLAIPEITKGLDKLGVFLPYSPLLKLITSQFKKPLVATSGNLSGSPILYKDEDALLWLKMFADYILGFDRDIVAPQDDSVVQFTAKGRRVVLRRSRGLAPNYIPNPFNATQPALALGAELKGAFALLDTNNLYISQFLGDQQNYESNESYKRTLGHLQNLLRIQPRKIFVDKHPGYQVSAFGRGLAAVQNLPVVEVQHHRAHFAAVLAENGLMHSKEKILGVIWDGTGFGDDGQIWGGEFFSFQENKFERIFHLQYFRQLLGDKMSLEPRLAALSLLFQMEEGAESIKPYFSDAEFDLYKKIAQQGPHLYTSSMGRLLDGVASLLGIQQINSYEGEAAMKLEGAARLSATFHFDFYEVILTEGTLVWESILKGILKDQALQLENGYIARKVFVTLVKMIEQVAIISNTKKIAFSGGVFQNVILIDMVEQMLSHRFELYWHQQLSPNDEGISFGQLAYGQISSKM